MFRQFLPIVFGRRPDPRFAIQNGWGTRVSHLLEQERAMSLVHNAGHQHILAPELRTQTVQIKEWYDWYNAHNSNKLYPHALTYDVAEEKFMSRTAARDWIRNNRSKIYIIGNEPDLDYISGGHDMTIQQFAHFYKQSVDLIRSADSTAFVVMGAWARGVGLNPQLNHSEDRMLAYYVSKYGRLDANALSWHVYQAHHPHNTYPENKLANITHFAREWKNKGWTNTDKLILTEFGWSGWDPPEVRTKENSIAFLRWFVPKLKASPQNIRWHWWTWHTGSRMMIGGKLTKLGNEYKRLARA